MSCVALLAVGSAGGTSVRAASLRPDARPEQVNPGEECVRFWAQARYTSGYEHVVYLTNDCDTAAQCVVWTNVNPAPLVSTVPPYETVALVTFRGSPASVFTPFVRCAKSPATSSRSSCIRR
jgi:hypothetical protein